MARIRTIKPEFPQSETIGRLSRDARLLFVQLWTIVDDEGRARANSRMLASLLYPYDDDAPKLIGKWLDELEREKCLRRYEVDGDKYLDLPNWLKHQKIDHASKSRLPAFEDASPNPREDSRSLAPDLGPRTMDLGKDQSSSNTPDGSFDEFWVQCPKKVGKEAARKAYAKALKQTSPATIAEGMRRYAASRAGQDEQFTAHPASWLNAGRWADQIATNGSGSSTGPPTLDPVAQRLAELEKTGMH